MNAEWLGIGRTWIGFAVIVIAATTIVAIAMAKGMPFQQGFEFFTEVVKWAFPIVVGGKTVEKLGRSFGNNHKS